MEENGIIVEVTEPTDWVSSLVWVKKSNNKLRVCLDSTNLNKAIRRPHFLLPTVEDRLAKLNGAKIFFKTWCKTTLLASWTWLAIQFIDDI